MTAATPEDSNPLGPLFSTPTTRLLAAASEEERSILDGLLREPIMSVAALRSDLSEYLTEIGKVAEEIEFFDSETAWRVGRKCETLVDVLDAGVGEEQHRLIQLAVRYFIVDDDAESDTMSPIGYDDDEQVVDLVIEELRKDGLTIE